MHEAPDDSDSVKATLKAVRSVRTSLQTNRQLQAILQLLYQGLRDQSLAEKFNSDPNLLSVTEGVIDLRTGVLRARVKEDCQTYAVAIEFNLRDERLEELTGIMKDITLSDRLNRPEYLQYLQRVIGYCITGHSKEEIMIFLKGQGSNGKGIVESMLQGILGVLFYQAPKEVIIAAKSGSAGGASSHLMALKNKRVAYSDEIPRDKLDDNAITTLTGNAQVAGRELYTAQSSGFKNTAKLIGNTNFSPDVIMNKAMLRRACICPFDAQFNLVDASEAVLRYDPENIIHFIRNNDLRDNLPIAAFLAWAVEGAVQWYKYGLGEQPLCCRVAVDAMVKSNDVLQEWIDANCDTDSGEHEQRMVTTVEALCNYNHFRRCRIPPLAAVKKADMHTAMNAKGYHKQQCRLSMFEFRDKQVYVGLSLLNM
jgi:putative DNA primase/helicase